MEMYEQYIEIGRYFEKIKKVLKVDTAIKL